MGLSRYVGTSNHEIHFERGIPILEKSDGISIKPGIKGIEGNSQADTRSKIIGYLWSESCELIAREHFESSFWDCINRTSRPMVLDNNYNACVVTHGCVIGQWHSTAATMKSYRCYLNKGVLRIQSAFSDFGANFSRFGDYLSSAGIIFGRLGMPFGNIDLAFHNFDLLLRLNRLISDCCQRVVSQSSGIIARLPRISALLVHRVRLPLNSIESSFSISNAKVPDNHQRKTEYPRPSIKQIIPEGFALVGYRYRWHSRDSREGFALFFILGCYGLGAFLGYHRLGGWIDGSRKSGYALLALSPCLLPCATLTGGSQPYP
jgi:hypothetical protein